MTDHRTEWLTTAQVAERLGLHVYTIRRWCRDGALPAWRKGFGGDWRINPDDLTPHEKELVTR